MRTAGDKISGRYVAFLRGINVGGHNIKMVELKQVFGSLGFENVRTVLATGNVLFVAPEPNKSVLTQRIEEALRLTFGYEIGVLLRTLEEMELLSNANPFKGISVGPQIRLYVSFLSEKPRSDLQVPYESPDGSFTVIRSTRTEVCSVLTLSPDSQTTDLMAFLAKGFGNKITTRNWNTIIKILRA